MSSHRLLARISVCALLTCHNRRDKTIACLRALGASTGIEHVSLRAVMVDDGSSDGTAEAVKAEFPWIDVLIADSTLFWCRGMHLAHAAAAPKSYDHYLWLNDDTMLHPQSLARLLACADRLQRETPMPLIVVGSTADPSTGAPTYGGQRQPSRLRRMRVELVVPGDVPKRCDTFTGNVVLVPAKTAAIVGNLDPVFEHAMGDTDYGFRARRLGVAMWVAPGFHGTCADNPRDGTYVDARLPLARRWRDMLGRKGLPYRSWLHYTRRHMGVMWPLYFAWPYAKLIVSGSPNEIRRCLSGK